MECILDREDIVLHFICHYMLYNVILSIISETEAPGGPIEPSEHSLSVGCNLGIQIIEIGTEAYFKNSYTVNEYLVPLEDKGIEGNMGNTQLKELRCYIPLSSDKLISRFLSPSIQGV